MVCIVFCITLAFQQIRKTMTTTIKLSSNNKTYEIWYTNNGTDFKLHKKGITSIDEAMKEEMDRRTACINLLNETMQAYEKRAMAKN